MIECLTYGGVLPEDVSGVHRPGVGKTPQRLAVGRYMAFAYAVW